MKITIVSDTLPFPQQINGVSRSLSSIIPELEKLKHEINLIHPGLFKTFSLPLYKEIQIPYYVSLRKLNKLIPKDSAIWIATEGCLGWRTRRWCLHNNKPFTTAFLTMFAEQFKAVANIPPAITHRLLKRFHKPSKCIFVATNSVKEYLEEHEFKNLIVPTGKGVDCNLFKPYPRTPRNKPIAIYVGRISKEKNIEAFLECKNDVTKIVAGDGPFRKELEAKYPDVKFTGYLYGEELAKAYSDADVLVMPSKTETFGLVMIEALACSTPVASFPAMGSSDIIKPNEKLGCLDHCLERAIDVALATSDRDSCRQWVLRNYQWGTVAKKLVENLVI